MPCAVVGYPVQMVSASEMQIVSVEPGSSSYFPLPERKGGLAVDDCLDAGTLEMGTLAGGGRLVVVLLVVLLLGRLKPRVVLAPTTDFLQFFFWMQLTPGTHLMPWLCSLKSPQSYLYLTP